MLKDVFGFAENQQRGTFGLDYRLTLTRKTDKAVLNKDIANNIGKIKIISVEWYVPHYIRINSQQAFLSKQILSKVHTELHYVENSVFMKEVNTQNLWNFELGTQEAINVPIKILVGFQQRDMQDSQNFNNDTFLRPPVTSAQCTIGTEKFSDSAILSNDDDDDYSQGYGQIREAFKVLTEDDILKPYISDKYLRSADDDNDIGYNLYIFDIWYQKKLESAQPINVESRCSENSPAGMYDYALVLKNKLVTISSDGERHFALN